MQIKFGQCDAKHFFFQPTALKQKYLNLKILTCKTFELAIFFTTLLDNLPTMSSSLLLYCCFRLIDHFSTT